MAMIPAICTQCGANLQVDNKKEAGVCEHCGTAFITEKVINNYKVTNNISVANATINVSGADIGNLLLRAQQYEEAGDYVSAKEYYNRILDIDANHKLAKEKVFGLGKKNYIGKALVDQAEIDEIEALIKSGKKLDAIKLTRIVSGLGLAEAKFFVENFYQLDKQEPQEALTASAASQSGCYVATCVYGSYDCPQVWTLRRYRDTTLAGSWYGRAFIHLYYAVSPTIVNIFGEYAWFKKIWKSRLDKMVLSLQKQGVEDTPYQDKNWR